MAHDVDRVRNRHRRPARDPRAAQPAIARYMMWPWAKKGKSEERDRQAQEAQEEEEDQAQQERQAQATRDVEMLRSKDSLGLDDSKRDARWGPPPDPLLAGDKPPPQDQGELPGVVVTTRIRIVVIDVRISGLGSGQPVMRTTERREVPVIPMEQETPAGLARRAEECLGNEMEATAAAAGGEKAADLILPAQWPAPAAEVADLKFYLHRIMLGQLVPPLAQYVPLPGIDRWLDTAEVVILVGGIVLGTVTANPALYSVCVKPLAHKAIADAAAAAIRAELSDYARPIPPVRVIPEGPVTFTLNTSPLDKRDVSPGGRTDLSPHNRGMRML